MTNVIRARYSQFTYGSYHPSNLEILFEILHTYGSVKLPDGCFYKFDGDHLYIDIDGEWLLCTNSILHFCNMVKDFDENDWDKIVPTNPVDPITGLEEDAQSEKE